MTPPTTAKKPKYDTKRAWGEARALIWEHRRSVAIGLVLMLVSRAAGLVLPYAPKYVIDEVLPSRDLALLTRIALIGGAATLVNAVTSFVLSK